MAKPKQLQSISDLTPDIANVNKGSERGAYMLDWSLTNLGAGRSILADADGHVIAGNKTLEAAAEHQLPIRVVQTDGKELVVVQRTDLRLQGKGKEKEQARQLAVADNRASEVGYVADAEVLLSHVQSGVDLSPMFREDELKELLDSLTPTIEPGGGGDEFDTTPVDGPTRCQVGDLWVIGGKHRLLCGDSTKAEDVARLMGGEKAALMASDPPYNVSIDYGDASDDEKTEADYEAFSRAWLSAWAAISERQIVTPGCYNLARWCRYFEPYHIAAWTKLNSMTNGKVSRFWCWEPVLFFGEKWQRKRAHDVFEFSIGQQKDVGNHPCPKPLTMWLDLVENYSEAGDVVCDAFGGSGTMLIAAHRLGRASRLLEISPQYCDVIIKRAEAEGLSAEKVVNG